MTKKVIVEEGYLVPQLIHICQLIVNHPQLFYPYHTYFISHIVYSLSKIGIPSNTPIENKKLAIDLAQLILNWETSTSETTNTDSDINSTKKHKITGENSSSKRMREGADAASSHPTPTSDEISEEESGNTTDNSTHPLLFFYHKYRSLYYFYMIQ